LPIRIAAWTMQGWSCLLSMPVSAAQISACCISAKRVSGLWNATLLDLRGATKTIVTARALVNAGGPWAAEMLTGVIDCNAGQPKLQLVKGSHIIVRRLYEGEQCYVLQNEDRRIVFVMPYETNYSLIGTTDIPIAGGPAAAKISTYRRLAEDAIDRLLPYLKPPNAVRWTATTPLPGGNMEGSDFHQFLRRLRAKHPWLDIGNASRLARAYGTRVDLILGNAHSAVELGTDFGAGLAQAEIDYLIDQEFARTAEDILWRRSKRGLHLSSDQIAAVSAYVDARVSGRKTTAPGSMGSS
jgi:glycerol-3-phosphate dehydrogenase